MKDYIREQCLLFLKRGDVKEEIKNIVAPILDIILLQIYPYIYLSLIFVIISFFLHLGIFILLLRNNKSLFKSS